MGLLHGLLALILLSFVAAECPNACSGHGDCSTYDQCICYRNWQAADCSERVCPFGLAHVDSPKGNLDGSIGDLNDQIDPVTVNDLLGTSYPTTTELYPLMEDSYGNTLTNTAHWYMECSNKGLCDRKSGLCKCFTGYEGHTCQRTSCPNDCSGHGTCHTIEHIANYDYGNTYKLWDRQSTMGCLCDASYTGADCSLRQCPMGLDPFYTNQYATASLASWKYNLAVSNALAGTYAIKFYDAFGEDYVTAPIAQSGSASACTNIVAALEALPNYVVPESTVTCTQGSGPLATSVSYTLKFNGNPGELKQIEIDQYLDGTRSTLFDSTNHATAATVTVTSGGTTGEFTDYFTNYCEGVVATVTNNAATIATATAMNYVAKLTGLTGNEMALLKKCLGDSNGDSSDNVEIYNWDYGRLGVTPSSTNIVTGTYPYGMVGVNPHAIKLIRTDRADIYDSGHVYLMWYNGTDFLLMSEHPSDTSHSSSQTYYVYTTDSMVDKVMFDENNDGDFTDARDGPVVAKFGANTNILYTNIDASCNNGQINNCIAKGDYLFIPAGGFGNARDSVTHYVGGNASNVGTSYHGLGYTNMVYKVVRIWNTTSTATTGSSENRYRIQVDKNINWDGSDLGRPWGGFSYSDYNAYYGVTTTSSKRTGYQQIFKFTPGDSSYQYVSECAGRGACDRTSGLCNCFKGYTNYNCDTQSALAI